jgi:hypothetical protein
MLNLLIHIDDGFRISQDYSITIRRRVPHFGESCYVQKYKKKRNSRQWSFESTDNVVFVL